MDCETCEQLLGGSRQRRKIIVWKVGMNCRTCDDLLDAYKSAVRLYTTAAREIGTLAGNEFRVAFKQSEGLRQACRDADNAVMAHLRQDHSNFSHKPGS
jgi:hypothetical protein